jgi:hypothetical protein
MSSLGYHCFGDWASEVSVVTADAGYWRHFRRNCSFPLLLASCEVCGGDDGAVTVWS